MSTTTASGPPDLIPPDPATDPGGRSDFLPSATRADTPTLTRTVGAIGLALVTAGVVSVVAAGNGRSTLFGEGYGYLAGVTGLALLFVHALRDGDPDIRRAYGGLAAALLLGAVVLAVFPAMQPTGERKAGALLLPWGVAAGFLSLAFFVPFSRHEDDPGYRKVIEAVLLSTGASLVVSVLVAGLLVPDFLVGPGLVLGLLGVGFLALYLNTVDPAVGLGRQVAVGLGAVGLVCGAVAVGRSVGPTVLYDGPAALRAPDGTLDAWKAVARGLGVLAALGVAGLALARSLPVWLRAMLAVLGVALAGVLVAGCFAKPLTSAPAPFLVPYGLILAGLGVVYGLVSAGVASDAPVVVLTRRELTAYFFSPVAYFVLFGMTVVAWVAYLFFLSELSFESRGGAGGMAEPVLRGYPAFGLVGAIVALFLVPALTMGLFAEEKRSGTYEVLMTAPVSEPVVVAGKFLGALLFYLVCWLPPGLFLVALRVAGGEPFDYRPALSFYLTLVASGAAFLAMGLFFSAVTRNQLVAAALAFAGMFVLLLLVVVRRTDYLGEGVRAVIEPFDFLTLWQSAAGGQLAVKAVVAQLSLAAVWLVMAVKALEARKWS